jgi:hypothetical protein
MNKSNDMTSKQDNEAFEKWWYIYASSDAFQNNRDSKVDMKAAFQAACEYKDAQYRPRYEESEDAIYINGRKFYSEKVVRELEEALAEYKAKEGGE